ncbi:adenylate/guanylate cyclase domain-containing protein [Plantactinospora sp. BC1]|uniref:adenylate/guanylate cyclase domain-containing protein n=1 Tax=unclassified Plantactinospora TaxID=2631981 RepID=UPI000D17C926|nr:adenylate/guanylate cyclase domain-containing protein [Plantactinospora sp. BC1]AVT33753.1 adenylyl cyclase [Plantactinospora sp. BC1]AVT39432.1 adenylyl cyclase [Plantactinospora sp. BB1]
MSATCTRCGRISAVGDRYCGGCGTELTSACPHCDQPLAADAAFCTACGKPRPAQPGRPAVMPQEDRRRVSVLFVDLIDFTPYVERADPELVRGMQTAFFSAARRVIGQYGGVVEKYIGDAVMALFGAPVATETDPLRCVRAGLELQRVLTRFTPTGSDHLRFRVGVATGEALVDVAAARDGGQAIVAGDVVNTASRMQSVAPPGGVLVCGTTYALTRDAIRYSEQAPVTLRGRSSPTEVWLALAPVDRQPPDREPDTTPLIDREHELGLLVNALHRSMRDRLPQMVTVLGHAGIGKSRLVRELFRHTERLTDEPLTWRVGRCPPFGENVTFAALADIVKAEAGILDTDPAPTATRRLESALVELVGPGAADRLMDALRPVVGLPGPTLPAEESESAWRRFLVALAARQPTVLVFEDLHWADEKMLNFVELLGAYAQNVPLLLLCTARPELVNREPSWAGTITGSMTVTLPPLRDTGIASLYGHIFGQAAFSTDMLSPLVEVADGNPLYAHEYVRMLIEQGALRQSGRGWSLEKQQDLAMPESVHSVIANRVDLLDGPDRMVLLAASVVGMQFWPGAVAAALGQPVESVERALRRLEQRDFVHEQATSTMAGQPEFRFRHVLVRDVCYQRLPRTERVARHDRTADWLDGMSRGRDTDLAEVLAHHRWAAHEIAYTLGVDTERYAPPAREALHRAARRAYALHALDAAAKHAGRALGLADDSDPVGRLQLELLLTEISYFRDGTAFLAGGGTDQLHVLADRLSAHDEPGGAARAWTLLGKAAWLRADRAGALSCLDHAVELFDALPDTAQKADAYAELGRLHMLNYERDPAVAAAGAAADIAERLGLVETQTDARITVATARYQSGDRAGLDELHTILRFCQDSQLVVLPRVVRNLSHVMREEGDWIRADELVASCPALAQAEALSTGGSAEAVRAYYEGDIGRLLTVADGFVDTAAGRWDMQVRGMRAYLRVLRAEPVPGAAPAGRAGVVAPDEAQDVDDVTDALETARRSGFHRLHWNMLGLGALCRALQGRTGEAAELLDELAESWAKVPALASGEWIPAASYAAALTGRESAVCVRGMLDAVTHSTLWVEAAVRTVTAALAGADGDHARAGQLYLAAAESYAQIPDVTDRMLGLALAAGELALAGDDSAAEVALAEVRAFALRNRVPGLLRLGQPPPAPGASTPMLAS